jgi:prepilin-type N-terminal cleavage/methylation domain-containing protein
MTSDRGRIGAESKKAFAPSFSLVEMLVALAILSIIVVVLLSVITSLMSTWQLGQARNERRTVGRDALERMARDLRLASMPLSKSNATNLEFVVNPAGVSSTYELPQAVFWQAPVASDGGINGNLAIVGYFVQWINGAPSLTRVLINPSMTTSYTIYSNPTWMSDALIQLNAPATASSGYAGLMAENVLGLWVQALDPQGNPIQQSAGFAGENFDSRLPYAYTNTVYGTQPNTNVAPVLPASVQIAIVIIDSRTAKRLTGVNPKEKPSAITGNFWSDIQNFYSNLPSAIQKGAEIQTTTVEIAASPR